tara:strand:- start:546 stop:782 length:237 start_codon:yes stop_codon:yes gene_type:complete
MFKVRNRYDFIFYQPNDEQTITVKGKGLKEAVREYRQQNPNALDAEVHWISKSGQEMQKFIKLREVNIGIDRYGNIIR